MNPFDNLKEVELRNLLVAFYDIRGFLKIAKKQTDAIAMFSLLNGMAIRTIDALEKTNGRLIKFVGDSALIIFPEDDVDAGVLTMLEMKVDLEGYFRDRGFDVTIAFGLHYGEAAIGPYGKEPYRAIDVLGHTVNHAAMMERGNQKDSFTISPQAFKQLSPATRKRFRKFTPPIVYTAETS